MGGFMEPLVKTWLGAALDWFQQEFRQQLVGPIESHFPKHPLPRDVQAVLRTTADVLNEINRWGSPLSPAQVRKNLAAGDPDRLPLFKQILLLYRRHRAADTEAKTLKTFHLELTETLEREVKALDALVDEEWFRQIAPRRLPRLKDFLPVQLIEAAATRQLAFAPRQYDQKFPILQAPGLFLPDVAFFRSKCEDREAPLAIAFFDIDHFKQFNTDYTEPTVDRNLLPRFLQAVEAHVYHHGYAYHEGGDEFMILVPGLSRPLAVAFLDELRRKLAGLEYPDIKGNTTVSGGLCVVEPDCPLTDRELRDRASRAKKFAKEHGRNCLATYNGPRFVPQELEVVKPQHS